MRTDTPIYFQTVIKGDYDSNTGNYKPERVTEVKQYASVTDSGVETMQLVYGGFKQGSKIIRLLNHYDEPFDRIRIGVKKYRVDMPRKLRAKHTFVVSEVKDNATTEN